MGATKTMPLSAHLRQFAAQLKGSGITIDTSSLLDYYRAVQLVGIDNREDFKQTSRATLISDRNDLLLFDQLFDRYWSAFAITLTIPTDTCDDEDAAARANTTTQTPSAIDESDDNTDSSQQDSDQSASAMEVIRNKDLAQLSATELAAAQREIARIAKLLAYDYGRRRKATKKGPQINFRKLLRLTMLSPDIVEIPYRQVTKKKSRLFVLCDISGSMDRYSRFFLHFLYAIDSAFSHTSVALFSTETVDITADFKQHSIASSLEQLSQHITQWSGGTKIGSSVQTFVDLHGERMNAANSVCIIISDGWDTGKPETLAHAMITLRQRSRCLMWLNPLLGEDGYQPLCQGMRTALPYVDHFMPAHNIDSLTQAIKKLSLLL